ncbi:MAG: TetR/AcrR family transcriptional regulator [Clostridiales bacterium]|nr:TetR/AcrR family transcriptional regulator [Clostridiales bacterium]
MGNKLESNKKQKKEALLNTAFDLFTTKGIHKTSISDIVNNAGVAKGTFYLYFTDKYDIRNKLIAHKASGLFLTAYDALLASDITDFEEQIIFMVDHILEQLSSNKSLLKFIAKHLSWGVFKNAMITSNTDNDKNIYMLYEKLLINSGIQFKDPEIMIFSIIEFASGISYNTILFEQPVPLEKIKPYMYENIRQIIANHKI